MGKNLFAHAKSAGNVVLTGTEAGDSKNAKILKDAADAANFWCWVHDTGEWVAFDKSWGSHIDHGWKGPMIPGQPGPASEGGHSPRGLAWVQVKPKAAGPNVSIGSVHFLTQKSMDAQGVNNSAIQKGALDWCKAQPDGHVVFVNGDVNMDDANKNVWATDQIITCWDELKKWPATIEGSGRTIDVISRYKPNKTSFSSASVLGDDKVSLSSDHKLIQATVKV